MWFNKLCHLQFNPLLYSLLYCTIMPIRHNILYIVSYSVWYNTDWIQYNIATCIIWSISQYCVWYYVLYQIIFCKILFAIMQHVYWSTLFNIVHNIVQYCCILFNIAIYSTICTRSVTINDLCIARGPGVVIVLVVLYFFPRYSIKL